MTIRKMAIASSRSEMSELHQQATEPFKILIVDDEDDARQMLRLFLESQLKVAVAEASSAPSAIELLQVSKFDLVVCDFFMPEGNGLEVLEYLKSHPNLDVWFVLFSGSANSLSARHRENILIVDKPNYGELVETIRWLSSIG